MLKSKASLKTFFIFNSTFGPKEGEELKRILYFHPATVDVESQKLQVGLCEAVIKYMSTFSMESCEALHTQKTRHIFYQPEENYWMVMVVNVPYITKAGIDGIYYEYHAEEIQPKVLYNSLVAAYRMFRLFVGLLADLQRNLINKKCESFFTPYLLQMSLMCDTRDIIQGINYLPLEKSSFFKVMCFIDLVEVNFPDIKCIAYLYNDQLVWNGIMPEDMLTLYKYLIETLLPDHIEKELQGGAVAAAQKHGRYISPQSSFNNKDDLKTITKIHLQSESNENKIEEFYLIIYRALNATVCFTIKGDKSLSINTFRALDTFIGPKLNSIASSIGEHCANMNSCQTPNSESKFIYFNRLNLACKTLVTGNKLVASTIVKPEVLNLIADIHTDRQSLGNNGEIIIRTIDDFWVTGKTSNEREFYVIIQQKNANLKDINDEVKRVCDAQMKGIFFYPV